MLTVDTLCAFGADTKKGLGRCMNNEACYLRLVGLAAKDGSYEALRAALDQGDLTAAFEAAHALKGVLGNLSLTALYTPVSELTELLRARREMDYAPLLSEVLRRRDALLALCEEG